MTFGARLRRERQHRHLSQEALAEALGTTSMTIGRWERNQTFPHAHHRLELCRLFGLRPQDLFEEVPPSDQQAFTPSLWHVPSARNPFFTGREEVLQRVYEMLHQQRAVALTQSLAISGLGGIGKTQIALEYAHRYCTDYQFIFWTSAATQEALFADIVTIADALHLPERNAKEHTRVLRAVKHWWATHPDWLLIVDNADDVTILQDIVPMDSPGHLLLTSRAQAFGVLAQRLDVDKMGMAEASLFLLHRARLLSPDAFLDQAREEHLVAAEALAIEMDFLPLALDQAGAYIDEVGCGISAYLDLYRTHRKDLLQRRGQVPTAHPDSVAITWSLNFQCVEQANPAAADLLRLCAFLEPDTIPEELFTEGRAFLGPVLAPVAADALALNAAIEVLRMFSLVSRDPDLRLLRIHRLVQAVLKDAMEPEAQQLWAERVVRAVNAVFPESIKTASRLEAKARRLLPQAQVCSALIQEAGLAFEEAASLLYRTASTLSEAALCEQAEPLFLRVVQIREHLFGTDAPEVAASLGGLALLYRRQGKYAQAESLFQRALHFWEQAGEPDQVEAASLLMNVGLLYGDMGKYAEAERVLQQAINIREQILGEDHLETTHSLHALGLLYCNQRRYTEAERVYTRALALQERTLGTDHPDLAPLLGNLGVVYLQQERYNEAEPLLKRALQRDEQVLGPKHPSVASMLSSLGTLYLNQKRYIEAEPLFWRALAIWEQALGTMHQSVAFPLNNLGNLYREQGREAEAEPLLRRALSVWEHALGPDHRLVATSVFNLGELLLNQQRYTEAEPLFLRALAIWKQTLDPDHPFVATALFHLGNLYCEQENKEDAERCYQRALTIRKKTLGPDHQQTTEARTRYLEFLQTKGQAGRGETLR